MSQKTLDSWLRPKPPKEIKPHLVQSAKEALEPLFHRPIPDGPRYKAQLEEEYELIDQNKFTPVFLQVRTVLQLIEEIGSETGSPIPHIIRGSAGSSLVCYLLGITHIDPIKHGIQLARFMNKGRKDIPDIDIDVPYNRREEIYGRIAKTWPGAVARISNYNLWSNKTALRECVKEVLKESHQAIPRAVYRKGFDAKAASKVLDSQETLEQVKQDAKDRVGKLRSYSKHCGGIVIYEEQGEVPEDLVLKSIEANGTPLVQIKLNKDDTESAGLIKIDLLSNRGLAQLAQICPDRPLTQYPSRDGRTEWIFEKGWNIGITFGESRGMRKLFMELKPQNVLEVAVALALIRPAAAAEGRKQEFLHKWKHPSFRTGGTALERPILFDDDAICKVRKLLACSSAEADKWRKCFAKGNARARIDFRLLAKTLGHSQDTIDSVVDDLNQLVYYSFCKSHAVSYAQLVWALAYWKAHRPHEFWASALNHCHSEYRKWVHYREARCSGLELSSGPPPYRVVGTKLVSQEGQQTLLAPLTPIQEFRKFGYWMSEDFLPTCGVWPERQQRIDGKRSVRFRGLIATCRTIHREWGNCTLICLGVANREYIDLVIPKNHRSDLFRWAVLEGVGIQTKEATIEVESIHGVSLKSIS